MTEHFWKGFIPVVLIWGALFLADTRVLAVLMAAAGGMWIGYLLMIFAGWRKETKPQE